jgi:hypothetical protein
VSDTSQDSLEEGSVAARVDHRFFRGRADHVVSKNPIDTEKA